MEASAVTESLARIVRRSTGSDSLGSQRKRLESTRHRKVRARPRAEWDRLSGQNKPPCPQSVPIISRSTSLF